jgi:hypothetical protein
MRLAKCFLRWGISLLGTKYIVSHLKEHNEVDRIEWQKLLSSFNNVKALRIRDGLVEELSRCLRLEDGEVPSSNRLTH